MDTVISSSYEGTGLEDFSRSLVNTLGSLCEISAGQQTDGSDRKQQQHNFSEIQTRVSLQTVESSVLFVLLPSSLLAPAPAPPPPLSSLMLLLLNEKQMHKLRTEVGFLELKEGCRRQADRPIQHTRPLGATVLLRILPAVPLHPLLRTSDPLSRAPSPRHGVNME